MLRKFYCFSPLLDTCSADIWAHTKIEARETYAGRMAIALSSVVAIERH